MTFVLDTNALSVLMLGQPAALERLRLLSRSAVLLPQPVVAEVQYGLARLPLSKRKATLAARFRVFADELRRAPWTDDVSAEFGRLKALLEARGERIEDFDVAIAAHATVIGATLVSSDARHLPRIPGLAIERWAAAI